MNEDTRDVIIALSVFLILAVLLRFEPYYTLATVIIGTPLAYWFLKDMKR